MISAATRALCWRRVSSSGASSAELLAATVRATVDGAALVAACGLLAAATPGEVTASARKRVPVALNAWIESMSSALMRRECRGGAANGRADEAEGSMATSRHSREWNEQKRMSACLLTSDDNRK